MSRILLCAIAFCVPVRCCAEGVPAFEETVPLKVTLERQFPSAVFHLSTNGKHVLRLTNPNIRHFALYRMKDGKEIIPAQKNEFGRYPSFNPDGTTLLRQPTATPIFRWDVESGKILDPITKVHDYSTWQFSSDGKRMYLIPRNSEKTAWRLVGTDFEITSWSPRFKTFRPTIYGFGGGPNRELVVASSGEKDKRGIWNSGIAVLDAKTGKERSWSDGFPGSFEYRKTIISQDGKTCACVCVFTDYQTNDPKVIKQLILAEAVTGYGVMVYDLETGKRSGGFDEIDRTVDLVFQENGMTLLSLGNDHVLRYYDIKMKKVIHAMPLKRMEHHDYYVKRNSRTLLRNGTNLVFVDSGKEKDSVSIKYFAIPDEVKLSEKQVADFWDKLLKAEPDDDGELIHRSYLSRYRWLLQGNPTHSVPFLKKTMKPAPKVDALAFATLLADLDNREFATRKKAFEMLEAKKEVFEELLQKALTKKLSLEVRRKVERLLAIKDSPQRIRDRRAVSILEYIDSPDSRELLKSLAGGAPEATLTKQAKAALTRLEKAKKK